MGMAVVKGIDARLDNVGRGVKIWLADLQVDHLAALCFQLAGAG